MKSELEKIFNLIEEFTNNGLARFTIDRSKIDSLIKQLMKVQPNDMSELPKETIKELNDLIIIMLTLSNTDIFSDSLSAEEKEHLNKIQIAIGELS